MRTIVAFSTNLGVDEVYYVNYARYPSLSFFDHPPMVGWLIKISTLNLYFIDSDFFVRLGSLVIGSFNILIVYKIGETIKDKASGLFAALLLSASFYNSIITGTFILPDTALSLLWLLAIWCFILFVKSNHQASKWLILFGLFVGLALLSKYHAVFLWLAACLYFLLFEKRFLFKPSFWLAMFLSLLLFSPVIWWNLTSEYSGINYHASRVGNGDWLPSMRYFFSEFFGQVFYNNPFNVILIVSAIIFTFKKGIKQIQPIEGFLLLTGIPLVFVTILMSFFNQTLPHWSGPSYFSLLLLVGFFYGQGNTRFYSKIAWASQLFFGLIIILGLIQIKTAFFINPAHAEPEKVGRNDFTTDLSVWKKVGENLSIKLKEDLATNKMPKDAVILFQNWFPAAHVDYYFAHPKHYKVYVLGNLLTQHEYAKINKLRGDLVLHSSAYYITTSQYFHPIETHVAELYAEVEGPEIIPTNIAGINRMNVYVWRLKGAKNKMEF